jgi:hypothetical protein
MSGLAEAILAMTTTMRDSMVTKTQVHTSNTKFKMTYGLILKSVTITKDLRVTPTSVVQYFQHARDIDIQAYKACNILPSSKDEWSMFLKFHLAHLQGTLHEELYQRVHNNSFSSTQEFWLAVWKLVFPSCSSREVVTRAIASYMIWDEPLGLERWKSLSQDLISYLSSICGKRGDHHQLVCSREPVSAYVKSH